jgi:biopolymer transport protein TolQ
MGYAFFQVNGFGEVFYAFRMSDWLGKSICILLLLISVGICSLVVEKIISLRIALKNSEAFLRDLLIAGNLFEMRKTAKKTVSPAGEVFLAAVKRFKTFDAVLPDKTCRPLTEKEVSLLRTTMECTVEDQLMILERRTMLLASAVGVCPFLGLFGTVWGITVAFSRLAQAGRADVQTLAPGVSGALLTTVLAIFVVIPAMLGSNFIASLLKKTGTHLDTVVEEIFARFQTEFM